MREVNARDLGKELELQRANGGRFDIHQLLFSEDSALLADSGENFRRLAREFERVCKSRKLRL